MARKFNADLMSELSRAVGAPTTYGQRGGTGPTAGKKFHTYVVTLPDGTQLKKRSATRDVPELWAIVATHNGRTHVTLWDDPKIGADTVPRGMPFQILRAVRDVTPKDGPVIGIPGLTE